MKFANVLHALYQEPWSIQPAVHARICDIVDAHITGLAHAPGGVANYDGPSRPNQLYIRDGIATLEVGGVIARRMGGMAKMSGARDLTDFERDWNAAQGSDEVDGILLAFDSPGGSVIGVPEAAKLIAASEKPVVAYTDTIMTSAAYWMASGAHYVMASESALVGGIGVFIALLDESAAMEKAGMKAEVFKDGKYKAMGVPGLPLTDEQREFLQARVDETSAMFKGWVRDHRGAILDSTMQGQDFPGRNAVAKGLVDEVGDLAAAVGAVRDLITTL